LNFLSDGGGVGVVLAVVIKFAPQCECCGSRLSWFEVGMSETEKTDSLSEQEQAWLFDFIVQFLRSPPWNVPIQHFIDINCAIFDDSVEHKLTYTEAHNAFVELVEGLLEGHLDELGKGAVWYIVYSVCVCGALQVLEL
jgi:hypothetical protein